MTLNPAFLGSTQQLDSGLIIPTSGLIRGGGGLTSVQAPAGTWGDGVSFGNRPVQSTPLNLNGQSGITISNLFFDNSTRNPSSPFVWSGIGGDNSHVAVSLHNCSNIIIENCDFMEVSECFDFWNCSNIEVRYNRLNGLVGPGSRHDLQTGNFAQTVTGNTGIWIHHNKIRATTGFTNNPPQWPSTDNEGNPTVMMGEDLISYYGANNSGAEDNYIDGTGYLRTSGTGIILGDQLGDFNFARRNRILNGGQVGINVVGGEWHDVRENWVWADTYGLHNQCMVHYQYQQNRIDNNDFSDNITRYEASTQPYPSGFGHYWDSPPPAFGSGNQYGLQSWDRSEVEFTL